MSRATPALPARRFRACCPARGVLRFEILPALRSPDRQYPRHRRLCRRCRVAARPDRLPAEFRARCARRGRAASPPRPANAAAGAGARPPASEQGVCAAARGAGQDARGSAGDRRRRPVARPARAAGARISGSPSGSAFSAGATTCRQLLANADLLVCPSLHEPFGNVVIEAWSAGLPVVATASDGPAALIEDEVSGLLVPLPDQPGGGPQALAAAIERVVADPGLRAPARAGRPPRLRGRVYRGGVVARYRCFFDRLAPRCAASPG